MSVFIGVDGGGTKTCCVAVDASRSVLGRFVSGASNQNSVGDQVAADNVVAGIVGVLQLANKTADDSRKIF
jgi:N-acetylglucosamine kinase-like BadF-type ATPase